MVTKAWNCICKSLITNPVPPAVYLFLYSSQSIFSSPSSPSTSSRLPHRFSCIASSYFLPSHAFFLGSYLVNLCEKERGRDGETLMGFNLNTLTVWAWTSKRSLTPLWTPIKHPGRGKPKLDDGNVCVVESNTLTKGLISACQFDCDKTRKFGELAQRCRKKLRSIGNCGKERRSPRFLSGNYARMLRGLLQHTWWHAIDSREDERKCCVIWFLIQEP